MATTVRTTITNKRRTPYRINTGRNRKVTVRGGETITLPYDLFSLIGRLDRNEYTTAMQRGFLDIKTEVVTPENTIVISSEGAINIQVGQETAANTVKHIDAIDPSFKPKKTEKEASFNSSGAGTVIADKSKDLASTGGMRTESTSDPLIKEVELVNGKATPIKADTANVMGKNANLPKTDSVSVFKTENPIKIEEPEETSEETANPDATEESAQINEWISNRDYSMLYAYLADNYPEQFATATKTAIRKCKTYDELKKLLNI